MFIVTGRKF